MREQSPRKIIHDGLTTAERGEKREREKAEARAQVAADMAPAFEHMRQVLLRDSLVREGFVEQKDGSWQPPSPGFKLPKSRRRRKLRAAAELPTVKSLLFSHNYDPEELRAALKRDKSARSREYLVAAGYVEHDDGTWHKPNAAYLKVG